jgi:fumarate hydratase class II
MTSTEEFRIEHDTMGEVRVPVNALYRAQTQRAVENFPISGKTLERAHIAALARVKKAAAQANAELGVLDGELAKAIADAADEVAALESTTATSPSTSSRPAPARPRT